MIAIPDSGSAAKRWMQALGAAYALLTAAPTVSQAAASSSKAVHGRALYRSVGCYECHDYDGQGARGVAPAIAPVPLGREAMEAYVRHPAGVMPPYSAKLVSRQNLDAIYAYLSSIRHGASAAKIPLLARFVDAQGGAPAAPAGPRRQAIAAADPAGQEVYGRVCGACHGADLNGGIGPNLRTSAAARSAAAIAAVIHTPPQGMPRLFPTSLSETDVRAVASYVASTFGR